MIKPFLNRYFPDLPSRCFLGLMFLYGIVILMTFRDYGINPDEEGHMTYGRSVVYWYLSGFQERRIFGWTNTWLYGGFFDTITYLAMTALPLDFFDTRHLCTSAMGMLGVWAAYRIGCLLGSKWAGVLAALFLILTPRYYGHAFNNHKDLPFAVLYLWSIYWQIKVLRAMPHAPWTWIIAMGSITGLALGIRVGGVMLLCFAGLFWLLKSGQSFAKKCLLQWAVACAIAYSVMLIFWPWAQTNPIHHPLKALQAFTDFSDVHLTFFEGQYIRSTEIPWYYAFKWLTLTLSEFTFIGLFCGLIIALRKRQTTSQETFLNFALLATAGLAPLIYIAWSNAPLYNGMRHVLFTLPPIVILSALGANAFIKAIPTSKRFIPQAVFALLVSLTLWQMAALHPNQYTFFNYLFAGGIKKASQNYETDYWDNSYKHGIEWLALHHSQANKKTRIFSPSSSTRFLLNPDQFELVSHPWVADIYITTTTLDKHRVIPGDVIHTINAATVPLLYLIKPNTQKHSAPLFAGETPYKLASLGAYYKAAGRKSDALATFHRVTILDPKNSWAHIQAGELYLDQKQPQKALEQFQKAQNLMAPNASVLHKMGTCYEQLNNLDEARKLYVWAVELRPYFNPAYRSLGDLLQREKRYEEALVFYQAIVDVFPESLGDWHRVGITLYHLKDYEGAAIAYQNLLSQDPTHVDAWRNLGVMLKEQSKGDEALEAYRKVLQLQPGDHRATQAIGQILITQKKWDLAIDVLSKHMQRNTSLTETWLLLAQAHRLKGDVKNAQNALIKYIESHGNKENGWLEYFELGKRYQSLGQREAAQTIYRAVQKILPHNKEVQDSLRVLQ